MNQDLVSVSLRRALVPLAVVMVSATSGYLGVEAVTSSAADADPAPPTEVFAEISGQRVPITEGQVVGQVPKVDGRCQIASPVGVGGVARDGEQPYRIRWSFDDQCRMVILKIERSTGTSDATPPDGAVGER